MKYCIVCEIYGGARDTGYYRTFKAKNDEVAKEVWEKTLKRLRKKIPQLNSHNVELFRIRTSKRIIYEDHLTRIQVH